MSGGAGAVRAVARKRLVGKSVVGKRAAVRFGIGIGALAVALVAPVQPVGAQCIPGISCGFSVKGKDGKPYLTGEVTPDALAKADAAMVEPAANGQALSAAALNKGANSGNGLPMPETEKLLMQMIEQIRSQWPHRAPPPVSVRIVGTTAYSASAFPDNVIVVPMGLLMGVQSDDELAWVLAHEFSHIALAHFSREAKQRRLKNGVDKVTACADLGLVLADLRFEKQGDQVKALRRGDQGLLAMSTQVWSNKRKMNSILGYMNQGLARKQEDQADAAAVDLAYRAAFSADDGFKTALERIQADEKRDGDLLQQFGGEFSNYMKVAGGQALVDLSTGQGTGNIFSKLADGLLKNAQNIALKKLDKMMSAGHRPAKKRLAGLGKYVNAVYADKEPLAVRTTQIERIRATAEYADARATVIAVDTAHLKIPGGACDAKDAACNAKVLAAAQEGLAAMQPALARRFKGTPLVANTVGFLYRQTGRIAEADRMYDIANSAGMAAAPAAAPARKGRKAAPAVAAPPVPPDPYMQQSIAGFGEHVDMLLRARNYAKAKKVIDLARNRFGDDEPFLPAMVAIAFQTKDAKGGTEALLRCYESDNPTLSNACEFAFMNGEQQDQFALLAPADQDSLLRQINKASADARRGTGCGLPTAKEVKEADKGEDDD
ncbi:M48 family metalloprotease [Novosphingobium jiangmenense]|nr:M48 family metalloprotease [Novosphingobium jiangmenense]